jgi:hypothetical protein
MDIEELKQFINESDFTPETKQKVMIVLAGKAVLDYDTYAGVKAILQQELDEDFKGAGVDIDNDSRGTKIEDEYESELDEVNKSLEDDKKFIEEETNKLNDMADTLDTVSNRS